MTKTKALLASALVFALAGCNTVKGFGKDLQSAGEYLSSTAERGVQTSGELKPVPDKYSYPGDVDPNYHR